MTAASPDDPIPTPERDRAGVDAALAEFNALRGELVAHSTGQTAILGLGLTAVGVVIGVAFGSSSRLILLAIVPILSAVVIVTYCGEAYRVITIGRYIKIELWPYLRTKSSERLPSWEEHVVDAEKHWGSVVEYPVIGMFGLIGVGSVLLAEGMSVAAVVAEIVLVVASTVAGVYLLNRNRD